MLFNSYIFLLFFFPLCLAGWFGLNRLGKYTLSQVFLLAMSLWFYGYFHVGYLAIMAVSIVFNYGFTLAMEKTASQKLRKLEVTLAVLLNLAILFYYKYFNFFLTNVERIFGFEMTLRTIVLPLGISFFTFQQLWLLKEVCTGEYAPAAGDSLLLYGLFFPAVTSGPILDKPGDLAGLLTSLDEGDVLFIDEIHRLSPVVEEYLYSAMEDFVIDIMIDKGPGARSVRISLNPFTLVGATTRSGLLTSPLRARFGITCALEYYDTSNLEYIVKRSASILKIGIENDAAYEIALRSRGTPRIANSLLRRVRDFAQVMGSGTIDLKIARYALDALNIDKRGLDAVDNKILRPIITKFNGGPVGANTIATAVGEDQGTLEEVYEPFLIKEGFIVRTPRGREATELAYRHLGYDRGIPEENLLF